MVYHGHFKCNVRRIVDYANLQGYLMDLYQQPGIAETVNFDHISSLLHHPPGDQSHAHRSHWSGVGPHYRYRHHRMDLMEKGSTKLFAMKIEKVLQSGFACSVEMSAFCTVFVAASCSLWIWPVQQATRFPEFGRRLPHPLGVGNARELALTIVAEAGCAPIVSNT